MARRELASSRTDEPGGARRATARLREMLVALASSARSSSSARCRQRRARRSKRCGGSSARPSERDAAPGSRPADRGAARERGCSDLLAGEVELERRSDGRRRHGSFAALVGWAPQSAARSWQRRLAPSGAAWSSCSRPPWVEPPTLLGPQAVARPFRPLVETYGAARYADLDPTPFAALSFVLMFGMMFGDVGHGLLLAGRRARRPLLGRGRLAAVRRCGRSPFAAGLSAALFGLLYGEFFGPTGVVPTLWLDPVDDAGRAARGRARSRSRTARGRATRSGPSTAGARKGRSPRSSRRRESQARASSSVAASRSRAGTSARRPLVASAGAVAAGGARAARDGLRRDAGRRRPAGDRRRSSRSSTRSSGSARARSRSRGSRPSGSCTRRSARSSAAAASALWGPAVGVRARGRSSSSAATRSRSRSRLLVAGVQALRLEYYELFSRIFAGEGGILSLAHPGHATTREEEAA